jgi:hypothetical protein
VSHLTIKVHRERERYRIAVYVDGQVEPTTVFGCRECLLPILKRLGAAQGKKAPIFSTSEFNTAGGVTSVAVHLPRGDVVTYAATLPQKMLANAPEGLS